MNNVIIYIDAIENRINQIFFESEPRTVFHSVKCLKNAEKKRRFN